MERISRRGGLEVITGPAWPGVDYFCTTRRGGASAAPWDSFNLGTHVGDDAARVADNRARLQAVLPSAPYWLEQVHGTAVFDADAAPAVADERIVPRADAAVTARAQVVLAILTADCLPVVLGSADGCVIGVAHAGWRGLQAGVLERTLNALRQRHPQPDACAWRAWVGPGIGQAHFEVGPEVRQAFLATAAQDDACFLPSPRPGHWLADLAALARARLTRCGVVHIDVSRWCTHADAACLYSYRRASVTGRMATLVWRTI